jgi:cytochrome c-type biogenesis protein
MTLQDLWAQLGRAVEGGFLVASLAALAWGVLSILLSPCHLASIPLIVGFISGAGPQATTRRALALSGLFSMGILVTIAGIGLATAAAGRMLGDLGAWANYAVAILFFAVGLHLLGVIPMPWAGPGRPRVAARGALGAFILGLLFGVALGPCTFAFMAPVLGAAWKLASTRAAAAVALLALYGVGHCAVIVAAGTFGQWVQRYLNWTEASGAAGTLRALCGILVLLGGVYLLYTAP